MYKENLWIGIFGGYHQYRIIPLASYVGAGWAVDYGDCRHSTPDKDG